MCFYQVMHRGVRHCHNFIMGMQTITIMFISLANNIIMKSCLANSYYMGISYRSTRRPSLKQQQDQCHRFNSFSQCEFAKSEDDQNIIHRQKNIQKAKEVVKYYNPYLARKQNESKQKKRKTTTHNIENQQLYKVIKIDKIKTEGDQSQPTKLDNFSISIMLPQQNQISEPSQQKISITLPKPEIIEPVKRYRQQSHETSAIFDHFPYQLSLKNAPKTKYCNEGKACASRLSNFFFPTNKVKSEQQRSNSKTMIKMSRPLTCKPRKKSSTDTRLFNFDGTLQNHKLVVPLRPQTANNQKKEPRKRPNQIRFWNYEDLAKKCIKMKEGKRDTVKESNLNIMPWAEPEEDRGGVEFFDISCSSIRGQFSIQF